jgi:hypothetical protein
MNRAAAIRRDGPQNMYVQYVHIDFTCVLSDALSTQYKKHKSI